MNRKLSNLVPGAVVGNLSSKTSFDQERERFEQEQNSAIVKSLSLIEAPPKEKHVRRLIISTFQCRGPDVFWRNLENTVPLFSNDITAWKFLIVFHRLMQDGDAGVIGGSLKHCSLIDEVCRSHAQLGQSSYGQLVGKYGRLILDKLAFHSRHKNVPGNFGMKNTSLEAIDAGDMFELGVEFLDQMEATAQFMKSIFNSFEVGNKSFSLTSTGQCRLSALIPCTNDSSRLLELTTNLIRLLHLALPWDTLDGHRARFHGIHKELRKLYEDMSHIMYLRSMLQIPRLAEDISHFFTTLRSLSSTSTSEDLSFDMLKSREDAQDNSELVSVATDESVNESMAYIQQEYSDLSSRYQMVLHMLEAEQKQRQEQEREHMLIIEQFREESESLKQHLSALQPSANESADNDEKLEKLKAAYQKLRTDHITILRQKAELDKKLIHLSANEEQLKSDCSAIHDLIKHFLSSHGILVPESSDQSDLKAALVSLGDKIKTLETGLLAKDSESDDRAIAMKSKIQTLEADNQQLLEQKEELEKDISSWASEIQWKKEKLTDFMHCGDKMLEVEAFNYTQSGLQQDDHLLSYLLMVLLSFLPCSGIDGISPEMIYPYLNQILSCLAASDSSSKDTISSTLKSLQVEIKKQKDIVDRSKHLVGAEDVEGQIQGMQNSINEAAKAMEKLMEAARANEAKKKNIDVDLKILDACSQLLSAIQQLIKEARELQNEITQASGTVPKDFYRHNHKWSQGLISAAKDIGRGAKCLVETSDGVVCGNAKFEELIVASQEIAVSTAQMVMASKVKADPTSDRLKTVSATSKMVSEATAQLIATCRSCASQLAEAETEVDLMSLSVHHSKKLEMEVQIRVLELEKMLEKQREKLFAIRKHQYAKSTETDQAEK